MSSLFCAISGEVPVDPVVSRKGGYLFERRLIETAIAADGKCPISGEPLTLDDLVAVHGSKAVKPRPVSATSIPGLLSLFGQEWDALMLESHSLKAHLATARQELSHALYQHDAACRVVARLMRERDEARAALVGAQEGVAARGGGGAASAPGGDVTMAAPAPAGGLHAGLLAAMAANAKALFAERKKRVVPPTLTPRDAIGRFKETGSFTPHQSGKPGITCLDMAAGRAPGIVATGGVDKSVRLFDRTKQSVVATLEGHKKAVNAVVLHPRRAVVVSGSADHDVRVWAEGAGGKYAPAATISTHRGDVTGLSLHSLGSVLASSSTDGTWAVSDIDAGSALSVVEAPGGASVSCAVFHPDGMIVSVGAGSVVRVFDVNAHGYMAAFEGHTAPVTACAFSENGYYLASASADGTAKIWDLRKVSLLHSIAVGSKLQSVAFDHSGQYLATGGDDVRVFVVKEWTQLAALGGHTGPVTCVKFGPDASFLASTSLDRSLKFWSA